MAKSVLRQIEDVERVDDKVVAIKFRRNDGVLIQMKVGTEVLFKGGAHEIIEFDVAESRSRKYIQPVIIYNGSRIVCKYSEIQF